MVIPPSFPVATTSSGGQFSVLVVDDDPENREIIRDVLHDVYVLHFAFDGQQAIKMAQTVRPHLILLDVVMPVMDGMQSCLRLKQNPQTANIPVIFLTTKNDPQTEAFGLDLGAEDFMTKPFNAEVLRLRIKRRLEFQTGSIAPSAPEINEEITQIGVYELFWERHEARGNNECISLTTKEMELLRLLVCNQGRVLTRERILEEIWPQTYVTDRTIDSHVKEMRKKFPPLVTMLKTIYGSGYRLDLSQNQ